MKMSLRISLTTAALLVPVTVSNAVFFVRKFKKRCFLMLVSVLDYAGDFGCYCFV